LQAPQQQTVNGFRTFGRETPPVGLGFEHSAKDLVIRRALFRMAVAKVPPLALAWMARLNWSSACSRISILTGGSGKSGWRLLPARTFSQIAGITLARAFLKPHRT